MVMESLHFTDNILVYPSLDYSSPEELELLRKRYPFAQIITLDNTDKFLSALETMLAQPSGKNPPSHPSDYKSNLKRLFSTIEARFSSPETEDNGYDVVYCINKRGEEAFSMGDLLSAEKCFLQALNLNPNYIYAFNNLGVLYGNLKQPQKAFEYLQTAVDIDPSNVIVTLNFLDLCLTLNSKLNNRYSISSKVPDER
jgi:tetratricopeptide (TPR) repeat protein